MTKYAITAANYVANGGSGSSVVAADDVYLADSVQALHNLATGATLTTPLPAGTNALFGISGATPALSTAVQTKLKELKTKNVDFVVFKDNLSALSQTNVLQAIKLVNAFAVSSKASPFVIVSVSAAEANNAGNVATFTTMLNTAGVGGSAIPLVVTDTANNINAQLACGIDTLLANKVTVINSTTAGTFNLCLDQLNKVEIRGVSTSIQSQVTVNLQDTTANLSTLLYANANAQAGDADYHVLKTANLSTVLDKVSVIKASDAGQIGNFDLRVSVANLQDAAAQKVIGKLSGEGSVRLVLQDSAANFGKLTVNDLSGVDRIIVTDRWMGSASLSAAVLQKIVDIVRADSPDWWAWDVGFYPRDIKITEDTSSALLAKLIDSSGNATQLLTDLNDWNTRVSYSISLHSKDNTISLTDAQANKLFHLDQYLSNSWYWGRPISFASEDTVTLAETEAQALAIIDNRSALDALGRAHIDRIDVTNPAADGTDGIMLTLAQVRDLMDRSIGFTTGSHATVGSALNDLLSMSKSTLQKMVDWGYKTVLINDATNANISVSVDQAKALSSVIGSGLILKVVQQLGDTTVLAPAVLKISDTAANIALLKSADIDTFAAAGLTVIDSSDNVATVKLTVAQNMLTKGVKFAPNDAVNVMLSKADLFTGTGGALAATTAIDTLVGGLKQMDGGSYKLTQSATAPKVILGMTAADIATLKDVDITTLAGKLSGLKSLSGGTIALTVAQAKAFAAAKWSSADVLKIADTADNIKALATATDAAQQISKLLAAADNFAGFKAIVAKDGSLLKFALADMMKFKGAMDASVLTKFVQASSCQLVDTVANLTDAAAGAKLDDLRATTSIQVVMSDTATNLAAKTGAQLDALRGRVDTISIDNTTKVTDLSLSVEQMAKAMNFDIVLNGSKLILADTGANIAALKDYQIDGFAASKVSLIDATDNAVTLNAAQAVRFATTGTSGIAFADGDTVVVKDTAAGLQQLTADKFAKLKAKGVDSLKAVERTYFNANQADALQNSGLTLAAGSAKLTVWDTQAKVSALTATKIAALAALGFDQIGAKDGFDDLTTCITVDQFRAMKGLMVISPRTTGVLADSGDNITAKLMQGSETAAATADALKAAHVSAIGSTDTSNGVISLALARALDADGISIASESMHVAVSASDFLLFDTDGSIVHGHYDTVQVADPAGHQPGTEGYVETTQQVLVKAAEEPAVLRLDHKSLGDFVNDGYCNFVLSDSDENLLKIIADGDAQQVLTNQGISLLRAADGSITLTQDQFDQLSGSNLRFADTKVCALSVTQDMIDTDMVSFWDLADKGVNSLDVGGGAASLTVRVDQLHTLRDAGLKVVSTSNPTDFRFGVKDTLGNLLQLKDWNDQLNQENGTYNWETGVSAVNYLAKTGATYIAVSDNDQYATVNGNSVNMDVPQGMDGLDALSQLAGLKDLGLSFEKSLDVHVTMDNLQFANLQANNARTHALEAMGQLGIDEIDIGNGTVALRVADALGLVSYGIKLKGVEGDFGTGRVKVFDTAKNLSALSEGQLASLSTLGIANVDLTNAGVTGLSAAKLKVFARYGMSFARNDMVAVADTETNIASLTSADLKALDRAGVKYLDSRTDHAEVDAGRVKDLIDSHLSFVADDDVVLTFSQSDANAATLGAIADRVGRAGVDLIDCVDAANTVSLTAKTFADLQKAGVRFAADDILGAKDSADGLSAMSAKQISALSNFGLSSYTVTKGGDVDAVSAEALAAIVRAGATLSLADTTQKLAIRIDKDTADTVGATDFASIVSTLNAQTTKVAVDRVVSADGGARLTVAQYQALASMTNAAGDSLLKSVAAGSIKIVDSYANLQSFITGLEKVGAKPAVIGGIILADTKEVLLSDANKGGHATWNPDGTVDVAGSGFLGLKDNAEHLGMSVGAQLKDRADVIKDLSTGYYDGTTWSDYDLLQSVLSDNPGSWPRLGVTEFNVTEGSLVIDGTDTNDGGGFNWESLAARLVYSYPPVTLTKSSDVTFKVGENQLTPWTQDDWVNGTVKMTDPWVLSRLSSLGVDKMVIYKVTDVPQYDEFGNYQGTVSVVSDQLQTMKLVTPSIKMQQYVEHPIDFDVYAALVNSGIEVQPAINTTLVRYVSAMDYMGNWSGTPYAPGFDIIGTDDVNDKLNYSGIKDLTIDLSKAASGVNEMSIAGQSVTKFENLFAPLATGNITVQAGSDTTQIYTGLGNDQVNVTGMQASWDSWVYTRGGDDTVTGALSEGVMVNLGDGNDKIAVTSAASNAEAPTVNGEVGFDSYVTSTNQALKIDLSGNDRSVAAKDGTVLLNLQNVEGVLAGSATGNLMVEASTLGYQGDWLDQLTLSSKESGHTTADFAKIITGSGNDMVRLNGTSYTVNTGAGADDVWVTDRDGDTASGHRINLGQNDHAADNLYYGSLDELLNRSQWSAPGANPPTNPDANETDNTSKFWMGQMKADIVSNFETGTDHVVLTGSFLNLLANPLSITWDKDLTDGIQLVGDARSDIVLVDLGDKTHPLTDDNVKAKLASIAMTDSSNGQGLFLVTGYNSDGTEMSALYAYRDFSGDGQMGDGTTFDLGDGLIRLTTFQGVRLSDADFTVDKHRVIDNYDPQSAAPIMLDEKASTYVSDLTHFYWQYGGDEESALKQALDDLLTEMSNYNSDASIDDQRNVAVMTWQDAQGQDHVYMVKDNNVDEHGNHVGNGTVSDPNSASGWDHEDIVIEITNHQVWDLGNINQSHRYQNETSLFTHL